MAAIRLDRWLEYFTGEHLLLTIVWLGLVGVTVALLVMMVTRWGQSQPLKKCVVLSLLTHLLLATYATTIEIVAASPREQVVQATLIDTPPADLDDHHSDRAESGTAASKPWERFASSAPLETEAPEIERPETMPADDPRREAAPASPLLPADLPVARLPADEIHRPQGEVSVDETSIADTAEATDAEAIDAPTAARREAVNPALAEEAGPKRAAAMNSTGPARTLSPTPRLPGELRDAADLPRLVDLPSTAPTPLVPTTAGDRQARSESPVAPEKVASGARRRADAPAARDPDLLSTVRRGGAGGVDAAASAPGGLEADPDLLGGPLVAPRREAAGMPTALPRVYERRGAPRKAEIIAAQGGSPASEAAVKLALKWLADHQSDDGRWDASEFGAGQERRIDGHNRGGAGVEADTGVTGLALLAFLGNGHTHVSGEKEKESEYRATVERGLTFLLASQKADGNLGGAADRFAMMYCHGMAALALSEAYAMTRDDRLLDPVRRAIDYTLAAQSASGGGWRYQPGDEICDTSQLGWQLMALKSAELAGLEMPSKARDGIRRFLKSVSSGTHGGLARYRPVAGERVTRSMTAEALLCRQFMGMARSDPASDEAGDFLLGELPGRGPANFYYWYYATLCMFQLQGHHWDQWKTALEPALIDSQRTSGDLAGSWDPDRVWGSHGGRVYATALGALCLEAYYRYLPLYVKAAALDEE